MNNVTLEASTTQLGWRFGIGVALIVGGYVALALIPLVTNSNLHLGVKTSLSGLLAITPFLSKIAAVAVMGKSGFNLVKQYVARFFGRIWQDRVSRTRYRFGIALFALSIMFQLLFPYFPGIFVDWKSNELLWSIVGDVGIIVSLIMLGGEFWNKVMALFSYDARVVVATDSTTTTRPT
ncbi:hypothetical protein G5V57_14035 [Nordella sp. HKS 07]|uniref:hypothetical protein n=1 Tax=Nordella sp. HKS 07 TaxID=2712222 RepID=UPI0013E1F6D4|nr:hypothetical protein [Nordella sp. HKS 07]QIG48746.1 hypothetical protein G5V57_14035 [Nordella sp. HKS 07]